MALEQWLKTYASIFHCKNVFVVFWGYIYWTYNVNMHKLETFSPLWKKNNLRLIVTGYFDSLVLHAWSIPMFNIFFQSSPVILWNHSYGFVYSCWWVTLKAASRYSISKVFRLLPSSTTTARFSGWRNSTFFLKLLSVSIRLGSFLWSVAINSLLIFSGQITSLWSSTDWESSSSSISNFGSNKSS